MRPKSCILSLLYIVATLTLHALDSILITFVRLFNGMEVYMNTIVR